MLDIERLCIGCMNDNSGEKVCSICGYDSKSQNDADYLATRTWLKNRYYVGKMLESNGEGATYIGWDNKEDSIVNIREYFPKGAANRAEGGRVTIPEQSKFVFNEGILEFLELNRKIMGMRALPALLPVVEVFEENGTAYSVSKTVAGITLREFLIRNGGDLNWEQARPLFLPVITTLAELHENGIIHRGVSPETIIVGRDGKLRLTSFCIRPVRMSKSNMVIQLFPGYSAAEQYDYDIPERDGRYTDVYGIAATLFRVLMGKAPTDVPERIVNDNMQIPARYAEKIPKYVLSALANALQITPDKRTRDMDAFRISLTPASADTISSVRVAEPVKAATAPIPTVEKNTVRENQSSGKKYAIISAAITAAIFIGIACAAYFLFLKPAPTPEDNGSEPSSASEITPPPSNPVSIIPGDEDTDKLYQVPKLTDLTLSAAIDQYKQQFNIVDIDMAYSDKPRGTIIEQNPTSDQSVQKGAEIQVVISAGPQKISVPNLIGKTRAEAELELLKQGFMYDNIKVYEVYNSTLPAGSVAEVEPGVGTKVSRNSEIVLRISASSTTSSENSSSEATE